MEWKIVQGNYSLFLNEKKVAVIVKKSKPFRFNVWVGGKLKAIFFSFKEAKQKTEKLISLGLTDFKRSVVEIDGINMYKYDI